MKKKIKYEVVATTKTHKERSWGDCQENNQDPSCYYDVTEPIVELRVGNIVIKTDRPTCGMEKYIPNSKKRLADLAKFLLTEKGIKKTSEEQRKFIKDLKSSFHKAVSAYEVECQEREKFAIDRLNKIRDGQLREWKEFSWKTEEKVDDVARALRDKK